MSFHFVIVQGFIAVIFFVTCMSVLFHCTTRLGYEDSLSSSVKYRNRYLDTNKFNYTGECGDVLNFSSSNERDFVIGSHDMFEKCFKPQTWEVLKMARRSMPKARIVTILYNFVPHNCPIDIRNFEFYNIEYVNATKKDTENAVAMRYISYNKYISKHIEIMDRVVLVDLMDVLFFTDFFKTFGVDNIGWMKECLSFKNESVCYGPSSFPPHGDWIEKFFTKGIRKQFEDNKWPALNGGFGYGGALKMKRMMDLYVQHMDLQHMEWGYDQALLNVLYYNGTFKELGLETVGCQQKLCYQGKFDYKVKNRVIYFANTKCSPIAAHKLRVKALGWKVG
ncbi:hypothetical protein EIN_377050 [Entamoeba invadens IP1]|uniref:Uncharacterized protein n=1 Tax=Entamoeba invadens IP1 TaxID=370355 RepID=A0A0A1TU83_ENTIV|nr:hypothetical protein EIN_377050 [Entamoeba invadens IP1]ELP83490.1 hypothetical protein EIN_377050 [Entamoeba invadens IP1]|eukprot:XP_004182836.1 hypothetical protein EIN_377050 [Entamoeba invadens IP1]